MIIFERCRKGNIYQTAHIKYVVRFSLTALNRRKRIVQGQRIVPDKIEEIEESSDEEEDDDDEVPGLI